MRIIIITNNAKPNSGWGRYSKEVIENLRNIGHIVEVVEAKSSPGVLDFITTAYRIRKLSASHEIVHALDGWPYGIYAFLATLWTRKKMFINGVGTYSVPGGNYFKVLLMKLAYRKACQILAISRYTAGKISEKVYEAKIQVIHLGLTILPDLTLKEKDEIKNKFAVPDYSPFILTVGEIKERKGQYDTLKAVARMSSQYPNIGYVMVGYSSSNLYRKKIEEFIVSNGMEERVRIISNVQDDKELAFFYSQCDVFCLNSRNEGAHFEGFGLVILEAGQFGKPSVGSLDCGIEDAIIDGKTGFLVPQGSTDEIARAIEKSLSLKKFPITEFSKSFSWRKTAERYSYFYKA